MIGLVMAGGRGSRMKIDDEKLLLLNHKKPVIMHVIDALNDSACFEKIIAVTSPHSPKTRNYLQENNVDTIHTGGQGYSKDLSYVLQQRDDSVMVTSGDLPFLDATIIKELATKYDPDRSWISFVVTRDLLQSLGLSSGLSINVDGRDCIHTGISLINAKDIVDDTSTIKETCILLDDKRVAFNLNTKRDYELLCAT